MTLAYLDSSALVKLVLDEADTGAMRRWYFEADRMACSIIGTVETRRAVARKANGRERVDLILRSVITLDVDEAIAANASRIVPVAMRTLDAIHLATALA
ncbi:MAG: type II toxin-antitoxin system VapC family toxin, partial [Candidatus Limnocylindrales bacterium]